MYEPNTEPLVRVEDVSVHFPVRGGLPFGKKKQVKAVDHISLCIPKGETFGLVGESGCEIGRASCRERVYRAV